MTQRRRSSKPDMGSHLKSLTAFYVPFIRLFGYVSAAGAVWVCGSWAYQLFSPSSANDGSNGLFAILLVVFLLFAVLCLSVKEGKPSEANK